MANKIPVNKVKKATKAAYLCVKNIAKIYSKTTTPLWSKSPETEREALLNVGKMLFTGIPAVEGVTEADTLMAVLKAVPEVSPNSVVGFLTSDNEFAAAAFAVYVNTVKVLV